MKLAVVFFAPNNKPTPITEKIVESLTQQQATVEYIQVQAIPETVSKRFFGMKKKQQLKLVSTKTDLSEYDGVFFGSTVEGMMPKRKLPPEMELFLKECKGIESKKVAVFLTAFGMAGTVPQKISSILATRSVTVVTSKVFTFLVNFSPEQLKNAREFAVDGYKQF